MKKTQNIFFEYNDIELLKEKISHYENQCVHIITSPKFQQEIDILYSELKRNFKVSISYISENNCYINAGVLSLWCAMRENVRLLIAFGNEHIHNVVKLLAIKGNLPYCYLCRDFPSLYTLHNGLQLGCNSVYSPNYLFMNFKIEKARPTSIAYTLAHLFSLSLYPLENFLYSRLINEKFDVKENKKILRIISRVLNISKRLTLLNDKSLEILSKLTLEMSEIFNNCSINSVSIFAEKFAFESGYNFEALPLINYFVFQTLEKVLLQFFINNCNKPFCISLNNLSNLDFLNAELFKSEVDENKLSYIFSTNKRTIISYTTHLDKLQKHFTFIIKSLLPNGGFDDFYIAPYAELVAFIKSKFLYAPTPLFSLMPMIKIV